MIAEVDRDNPISWQHLPSEIQTDILDYVFQGHICDFSQVPVLRLTDKTFNASVSTHLPYARVLRKISSIERDLKILAPDSEKATHTFPKQEAHASLFESGYGQLICRTKAIYRQLGIEIDLHFTPKELKEINLLTRLSLVYTKVQGKLILAETHLQQHRKLVATQNNLFELKRLKFVDEKFITIADPFIRYTFLKRHLLDFPITAKKVFKHSSKIALGMVKLREVQGHPSPKRREKLENDLASQGHWEEYVTWFKAVPWGIQNQDKGCLTVLTKENVDVLQELIDSGLSVNLHRGQLLSYSITTLRLAMALKLIESGAEVNKPSYEGYTPLQDLMRMADYYVRGKTVFINLMFLLQKKGADLHIKDSHGNSLLHLLVNALVTEHYYTYEFKELVPKEIFVFLLKAKLEMDAVNNKLQTPLFLAKPLLLVRYLIENGANVCHQDINGQMPLHAAFASLGASLAKCSFEYREKSSYLDIYPNPQFLELKSILQRIVLLSQSAQENLQLDKDGRLPHECCKIPGCSLSEKLPALMKYMKYYETKETIYISQFEDYLFKFN